MILTSEDLTTLSNIAIKAAHEAGSIITYYSDKNVLVQTKENKTGLAAQVVTEVDFLCQESILNYLKPTLNKYQLALLSEEMPDDNSRLQKDYFWCIDPLDGTLAFTRGTNGYSVSIALISKDGESLIGVVFDPAANRLYHAIQHQGAFLNNVLWKPDLEASKAFCFISDSSFSKSENYENSMEAIHRIAEKLQYKGIKQINHGGGVMNACWVLENTPGAYIKFPRKGDRGGSLWDYAATTCIFNELGAIVCDFYGNKPDLNRKESTYMNHKGVIYASNATIASEIMKLYPP